jgi:hypothetical protein
MNISKSFVTHTDSTEDLGEFIDSKLHLHNYVNYISSQCTKLLGLVRSATFSFTSLNVHIKKLHGLSPQANYTDRATAACRRS